MERYYRYMGVSWVVKEFFMLVPQSSSFVKRLRHVCLLISTCLLLFSFFLASCSGLNFGGSGKTTPTAKPTPPQVALTKLQWCNKAFIVFRDEHAPVIVTPASATPTATVTATASATVTATTSSTATATATTSPTPVSIGSPTTITDWSQVEP